MNELIVFNIVLFLIDFSNGDKDGMILKLLLLCALLCFKLICEKLEKKELQEYIDFIKGHLSD